MKHGRLRQCKTLKAKHVELSTPEYRQRRGGCSWLSGGAHLGDNDPTLGEGGVRRRYRSYPCVGGAAILGTLLSRKIVFAPLPMHPKSASLGFVISFNMRNKYP